MTTQTHPICGKLVGSRLLLADDDEIFCRAVARLLAPLGAEVVVARDGKELLELLERGGFAVVVSDIKMPHLTGVEVLTRRRAAGDATPFLLMTGNAEHAGAAASMGAPVYEKPVPARTLMTGIGALLGLGQAPA